MDKVKWLVIIFLFLIFCFFIKPVFAADNEARFNPITGNIEISTTGKLAPSSSWRYKTVGFIVTKNPSSNFAPLESPPCTEILPLIEKNQVDIGNGYATVSFEIPVANIRNALVIAGIKNLESGVSNVYLHAVFSTIEPGKKEVTGRLYTSYSSGQTGIMNATNNNGQIIDWSATTDALLLNSYNILTRYYDELPIDPSGVGIVDGKAEVDGDSSWRLTQKNPGSETITHIKNSFRENGTYFAMRNPVWSIQVDGVSYNAKVLELTSKEMNMKNVKFNFSYEYTNQFYDTYQPDLVVNGVIVSWKFLKREPLWDSSQSFNYSKEIFISNRFEEQIRLTNETNNLELLIGESFNAKTNKTSQYFERFSFENRLPIQLVSQLSLDLNQQRLLYNNDFGETLSFKDGFRCLYPPDIDENLKDEYVNTTGIETERYAIPLNISILNEINNQYQIAITFRDSFYMTKRTGFLFSAKTGLSKDELASKVKQEIEYVSGSEYDSENDCISDYLNASNTHYFIPISAKSKLKPGIQYENKYVIGNLGLSEITLVYTVPFTFGKFLIGSVFDEVYVNEEPAPLKNIDYTHSISIPNSKVLEFKQLVRSKRFFIHGFISTDSLEIDKKIRKALQVK
ncbi:MAG: hypothetical protein K0R18_1324 [Bacillales bacterium]|jgi:hypothetical protein|nr:hypothetical protein [Bacillales bacterium]